MAHLEEPWYQESSKELVAALAPVLLLVEGHEQDGVPVIVVHIEMCIDAYKTFLGMLGFAAEIKSDLFLSFLGPSY